MRKAVKILLIAAFFTFIWFLIAYNEPLGYQVLESRAEGTTNPVSIDVVEQTISGYVEVSLNPLLFPVSHICGDGVVSSVFTRYIPATHVVGGQRGPPHVVGYPSSNPVLDYQKMEIETLVSNELYKNLPLFFFIGLSIAYLGNKLVKRFIVRTREDTGAIAQVPH